MKAPVMRQNAFELALEEGRFSKPTRKGEKRTILFCIGGENRAAADSKLGKTASRYTSFEAGISRFDYVYRKLLQTPQRLPKTIK